jgi:hypothetical protein
MIRTGFGCADRRKLPRLLAAEEAIHDTRDPVRNNFPLRPADNQLADPI